VDEVARVLADAPDLAASSEAAPRALALVAAGLGIELGRLIVGRPGATRDVEEMVRLIAGQLDRLDLDPRG
jgi:hypothetical protein